jgi:hypothetical protein
MAESICVLLAAGGDHVDDFEAPVCVRPRTGRLRQEEGLRELLGYRVSSPTRAKEYLYAFDDGMELIDLCRTNGITAENAENAEEGRTSWRSGPFFSVRALRALR